MILGHENPDGDCIGSCLGLYNYLKENYEGLEVSVYSVCTSSKPEEQEDDGTESEN